MGIKGLNKFLKQKYPQVYETCHIKEYAHKTIAIDAFSVLYRYVIISDNWMVPVVNLLTCLLSHRVTPIFVLDGANKSNKEEELKRRKESKNKLEKELQDLEEALQDYLQNGTEHDILFKHMALLEKYAGRNKVKSFLKDTVRERAVSAYEIDAELLREKIERMRKQTNRLTSQHLDAFKHLLYLLRILCIQADSDAEVVCHHLAMEGKVAAVLSSDSDFLCYGTPEVLVSLDVASGGCTRVSAKTLLKALGFTRQQFTDFCIMCGTDYNANIPRVGPVLSLKQIQKYGSLEGVQDKSKYNVECLNYGTVRTYYRDDPECKMQHLSVADELDLDEVAFFLRNHGLSSHALKFEKMLERLHQPELSGKPKDAEHSPRSITN